MFSRSRLPGYHGPVSDHFDGERFHNQVVFAHRSFADLIRWMWSRQPAQWQAVPAAEPGPPPPARGTSLRATFVNHATVLLQTAEMNILTDPIWSMRASPIHSLGPSRVRPPGIRFEALPSIDVVLISHNHYDHMDLPTLKRLKAEHDPLFVVGLGNGVLLQREGIEKVSELDWWQRLDLSPSTAVSGVPAQHFSQRTMRDRDKRLWLGYVIHAPEGELYFAGDTGMGPHFAQIRQRFGPMRLSLLPIGAYKPRWFMSAVHLSPREAVIAHKQLQSDYSIGIHYGTFRLADDSQNEPLSDLVQARKEEGVSDERFWVLGFGEGRFIP
jgi:L-ascorbate metabolism protein UlaG (beta-lactamase superfamily)